MAKRLTYKQAQGVILDALAERDWTVKRALKVPHATAPYDRVRLYFKPQAIYFDSGPAPFSLGSARSLHVDPRDLAILTPVEIYHRILDLTYHYAKNPMAGVPGGGIAECIEEMSTRPDVKDPGALCAWIAQQRGEYGWRSLPHIKRGGKKTSKSLRSVMRRATNPVRPATADEAAEFALKRWGALSWRGPRDRDITWKSFASRIRATKDPGSVETATAISKRSGKVRDFALRVNPGYVPGGWCFAGRTEDKTGLTLKEAAKISPQLAKQIRAHCATQPGCTPSKVRVRLNPTVKMKNPGGPVVVLTEDGRTGELYEATKAGRARKDAFIVASTVENLRWLAEASGQTIVAEGPRSRIGPVTRRKRKPNPGRKRVTNVRSLVARALK